MAETKTVKKTNGASRPGMDEILSVNARNAAAMTEASKAWFSGWNALNEEMMDLAKCQMEELLKGCQCLMECRDPAEAIRIQAEIARSASEKCLSAATRVMTLTAESGSQGWTPIQERTSEILGTLSQPQA